MEKEILVGSEHEQIVYSVIHYDTSITSTTESMKINLKFPIKQKIFLIPRTSANITVMISIISCHYLTDRSPSQ